MRIVDHTMKIALWHAAGAALLAAVLALPAPVVAAETLSQVYKRVADAVVVIRVQGRSGVRDANGRAASSDGLGSGVLVSGDGKVVTAAHVVQTADTITVEFADDVQVRARVIGAEPAADLALLQLERVPPNATIARLGNSDQAEIGDQVFVVGAPLGISHTLTVGHVSARRRAPAALGMHATELLQTDAAINQGNSGGPMFNLQGEVIGVVSHIVSRTGGSDGLGFVVTANVARRLLFEERSVWSGLDGVTLAGDLARALNVPRTPHALLVQRVAAGSPAERLGVRGGSLPATIGGEEFLLGGDVILAVQGIALAAPDAYERIRRRLIEVRAARAPVHVTVLRGGATLELVGSPH